MAKANKKKTAGICGLFITVGKHSLPLSHSFDNPKTARFRSPFFYGFSILGFSTFEE